MGGTNIIQISASSPHPYEAALIANTVAIVYQKRDREWSSNESMGLKSFLQDRLNEKEIEMEGNDAKIEKYKRENQIYDIQQQFSELDRIIRLLRYIKKFDLENQLKALPALLTTIGKYSQKTSEDLN